MDTEVDITKLKYALYARKSTEGEERQIRSIPDQIKECEDLAKALGIHLVKPYIRETKSAKTPNGRTLFTQLIKDVQRGKYDGIVTWHPDRLARNMVEAGQIIDMLDNGTLKDLRFHSHQFTNDANGKMLLGMLFVFSKHYSDDLSAKVNRGIRNSLEEGKSGGAPKHGYVRDEQGVYVPDPKTFDLISNAWRMRSEGVRIDEIVDYLNKAGYSRETKSTKRIITMDKTTLSRMFKDPFYYGILTQANQEVDLRDIYAFVPATSEEMYRKVRAVSYEKSKGSYKVKKRRAFLPLRHFVSCQYCGQIMASGASKGVRGNQLPKLYYRCDNKACPRSKTELNISRNIRAKVVFEWVENYLKTDFQRLSSAYERFSAIAGDKDGERTIALRNKTRSDNANLKTLLLELDDRSLALKGLDESSRSHKSMKAKIEEIEQQIADLESSIQESSARLQLGTKISMSREEFLNLIKTAPNKMRAGSGEQKDRIVRNIFLNLSLGDQEVTSYHLKEPFASLLSFDEIAIGGPGGT